MLTLCYDGSELHGSQVQKNGITVTSVLQDAIEAVYGERLDVRGCSRTDSGVHANMYTSTFYEKDKRIEPNKIVRALNHYLPENVRVFQAQQVSDDFHVRYFAKGKEYVYIVHDSMASDPFWNRREYCWRFRLDEKRLQEQASQFVGTHDFLGFTGSKNDQENTVRTIEYFKVERKGERVFFTVKADGFLYNMVRIMIGTLLGIQTGLVKYDISDLLVKKDRTLGGNTAPACGLYLNRVFYDNMTLMMRDEERGYVTWQN